ncbi:hypothetical protein MNB_SV-15-813 [hydrothermal vent metagenome]|uniref:Uncharacterized protein n=1 Tax=hydrothermal vent metagenome TaxID=652676 RepID=A0A1W1EJP6_9ZZZZ
MKIVLTVIIILLNSCSSSIATKIVTVVNKSNSTLDYEDALRDRCAKESIDEYRYKTNSNYRAGWSDASKDC